MTDLQRIADIMHSFVQGYGGSAVILTVTFCLICSENFTVQWYPHQKSDCAIFTVLYHMSETMLINSIKVKEFNQVTGAYSRILWSKEIFDLLSENWHFFAKI